MDVRNASFTLHPERIQASLAEIYASSAHRQAKSPTVHCDTGSEDVTQVV